MKFKVIAGGIQDGGVQYSAGKIFDSAKPLHQIFPNKVELIGPESKAVTNVKKKVEAEAEPEAEPSLPPFGDLEDVSGAFKYSAENTALRVACEGKEFWVFDEDILDSPLNVVPLRKNQVMKFIRENSEGEIQ